MHEDMNLYDGEHAVSNHPKMSKEEWEQVYRSAWDTYYTPEHMETILRRGAATNCSMSRLVSFVFLFCSSVPLENVHPLQGGLLRRKYRRDRRPGMPIEPIWSFYPKYTWDFVRKYSRALRLLLRLHVTNRRLQKHPNRYTYTDLAMTPVSEGETETLELLTHSSAAREAVAHVRKIAHLPTLHWTERSSSHDGSERGKSHGDRVTAAKATLPVHPHQAVALRRRRLPHPMGARLSSLEFACRSLQPGARLRAARGARTRRRHRRHGGRRVHHARADQGAYRPHSQP
jgi:hypothetical protein